MNGKKIIFIGVTSYIVGTIVTNFVNPEVVSNTSTLGKGAMLATAWGLPIALCGLGFMACGK